MKSYPIEELVDIFADYALRSEKFHAETIKTFQENNPGQELPEWMTTDFNVTEAFRVMCKEIVEEF